jgi:serine/threonine protein kinase
VRTESREARRADGNFVDDKGQCYRAHEELGRGVLTSVRSACRHVDDRADDASDPTLAIKTVLPLWIGHPLAEARIARERDVSRALFEIDNADDELGCARVLAFGRQTCDAGRTRPFHVSARLRGCTLAEHLRGRSAPGDAAIVRGALEWIDDLLVALAAVHAAGWVHRDVKPQNVFLHSIHVDSTAWSEATVSGDAALPRRNGSTQRDVGTVDAHARRRARLLDFGLAMPIGSQRPDFDEPFGTPAYVSPEVIAGARIDARADLYSVGLILFHLVAGRRPFAGDPIALLEAHLSEPPPRLRSFQPSCSPALERAVALALNKAPGERPGSASELRALLSDVPEAHASL